MILFFFSISSQSLKDNFRNVGYKHTKYNIMAQFITFHISQLIPVQLNEIALLKIPRTFDI